MKTAKLVLVTCCRSVVLACARQYEHFIRVVRDGQDFAASDCDTLTRVVHATAGRYRLQEEQGGSYRGGSYRESFPRYRGYWSKTSPLSLDLYCASNMLQVTVTAVQIDQADEDAYKRSIEELSAEIRTLFGSGIEEAEDSILVNNLPW